MTILKLLYNVYYNHRIFKWMTRQGSLWNPVRKRTTTVKKYMIKLRNKY